MSKTAIVHEWVYGRTGSEKVFERLAMIYPEADLFTLTYDPKTRIQTGDRQIRTSFLDVKHIRHRRALTLPLMPLAWKTFDLSDYDRIVVSHHATANTAVTGLDAETYSYVHTPGRYIWPETADPRGQHPLLRPVQKVLQSLDLKAAESLTAIAGNSNEIRNRIARVWDQEATVIHPPVDCDFYGAAETQPGSYVLGFSRWVTYKRLDMAIVAGEAAGLPVIIAGRGPDEQVLRARAAKASVPVTFINTPSDEELRDLYTGATALVFAAHEDFGIIPVECQATGTPVVGINRGGLLDTVQHGESGILLDPEAPAEQWGNAIREAEKLSPEACRLNAKKFAPERFDAEILDWAGPA